MRKIASLLSVLMFVCALAFGQTRTVTGTVRDSKGEPIPFATITEVGTNNATQADANGSFAISVRSGARLAVSATGFQAQTLTVTGNTLDFALGRSEGQLQEVVVTTALGIRRRPKEIGYANTTINSERITSGNSPTLGQALSGKVAGLQIQNTSAGVTQDVRITLRGNRSITGNNQALIVLDGVPVPQNTISYINPNDIENVTVLKGGQAATLYGSDGVNGVLMITTKKGSTRPSVNYQHSSTWETISFMPGFQTQFGSGSDYSGTAAGANTTENFRPFENQQYGDPFNGEMREQGRVLPDGSYLNLPYSPVKNQKKDAFNTGHTMQNDVSLSGGDANSRFYLSAQDYTTEGVVPGDKYRRDNVRFNASRTFGKFKASFDGTYAQDRQQTTSSSFYFYVLNTAANIPLKDFKNWRTDKFSGEYYYNDYYPNPYFAADNNRVDARNNYLNGSLSLELKPTSWFTASYRLGTALTNSFEKDYTGQFLYSAGVKAAKTHSPQYNDYNGRYYANTNILGSVSDASSYGQRLNSDLFLTFDKDFDKISTKFILGNSIQARNSKTTNVASNSIVVPNLYNVGNRSGDLTGSASISNQRKYGYFGDLTLGYNDFIFLHGSARNDNTSVFFRDTADRSRYSYWYYGADVSLSLTDAFTSLKSSTLSYLKLRAGYNLNRNDNISPYDIDPVFGNAAGSPFGTVVGLTTGNTFPDLNLQPEVVKTFEVGFEASMFNSRINLDVSAYKQKSEEQIISAGVSSATGYSTYRVNAASLDNKGLEAELRANIIRGKDLTWDVNANYTYNTNEVTSIFQGLPRFQSAAYSNYGFLFAELGQPFPLLKTTGFQTDSLGRTIVSKVDGWPLRDQNLHPHGNTLPKHTIGAGTRIAYKGFAFGTNLEYRGGYVIYNAIGHDLAFTGSGAITAEHDRKPWLWPNSSVSDGSGKYVPNTTLVDAYWASYNGHGNVGEPRAYTQIGDVFVTSGKFLKVRDASLSYTLPSALLAKTKVVKGATITLVGRNLFTFLPEENIYTDPEFSATSTSSNAQGINTSGINAPPTRSYGFTLNVNF